MLFIRDAGVAAERRFLGEANMLYGDFEFARKMRFVCFMRYVSGKGHSRPECLRHSPARLSEVERFRLKDREPH